MPQVIALGPPPLTDEAADAALDAIDFIAATVRGIDTIDVTPRMQALWRQHLAAWYQHLPVPARAWYAGAPLLMLWIRTQWPYLPPEQRFWTAQQWAATLPSVLIMLEPVLQQTNDQLHPSLSADFEALRAASAGLAGSSDPELEATRQLAARSRQMETLRAGSITMTNNTIDLMRAINRR
jgi:hypothetical protein